MKTLNQRFYEQLYDDIYDILCLLVYLMLNLIEVRQENDSHKGQNRE